MNKNKYTLFQVFQQDRVRKAAGGTYFQGPVGLIMNTKFDIIFTFKFVYYSWKKYILHLLMLALLLATIITPKTDIRPEAGCHL